MQYSPRCAWRRHLMGRVSNLVLRRCLTAILVLECAVGAVQMLGDRILESPLIRVEESGHVTWFAPGEGEQAGIYEAFGIQFRLEDGEIRFYRSRQEIKSH